jgi:hypothetical protein
MVSTQSLRDQLDRYATGSISADALEDWLAAESWDMRRWAPVGLQRLVEAMQSTFIQHSDGKMSAEQLREQLLQRHDQLLRAAEATGRFNAALAEGDKRVKDALRSLRSQETHAFTLPMQSAVA